MRAPAPAPGKPRLELDPRFRRRRAEVRRRARRRRLTVLVVAAAVALTAAFGWAVAHSPVLDVDRVVVVGAGRTGRAAVLAAAGVHRGQALLDVDEGGGARRLAALPWVGRAEVRREWPGTVRIRVVERAPVAAMAADGGGWALVDASGRVLARVATPSPDAVEVLGGPLAGPPGATVTGRRGPGAGPTLAVAASLPPALAPRVAAVAGTTDALELRLRPRGVVRLGPAADLDDKLRAALSVLGAVDGRTVGVLDVRAPRSPVLTRV